MNLLKLLLVLSLAASSSAALADTNAPAKKAVAQSIEIDSDSFYYDGNSNQVVYLGNVSVTDFVRAWLRCQQLTVYLPAGGSEPTNIVAETNVVVDALDDQGQTNHITADKATYSFSLTTNSSSAAPMVVTNRLITFNGYNRDVDVENPHLSMTAEPLIYDISKRSLHTPGRVKTTFHMSAGSTNSTLNFLK